MKKKIVWLTGAAGQLGNAIMRHFGDIEGIQWLPTSRDVVDLSQPHAVDRFVACYKPDVVVNAAAFTNVDDAEINRSEAERLNSALPGQLAKICAEYGTPLFHFSTDHVFGGDDSDRQIPYTEQDTPYPTNYYAETKLLGERAVLEHCPHAYVWRTAWLYSPYGANFYRTILNKGLEGNTLRVVSDEVGNPTSAIDLARSVVKAITWLGSDKQIPWGLYHYSDQGAVSRYEFARAILELHERTSPDQVTPCLQSEYNTRARRPHFSALDISALSAHVPDLSMPWREALREVFEIDRLLH